MCAGVKASSEIFMVAELRYRFGFQRSPNEAGAWGRTQTPVGEDNTILGFSSYLLCGLLLIELRLGQCSCLL